MSKTLEIKIDEEKLKKIIKFWLEDSGWTVGEIEVPPIDIVVKAEVSE